MAVEFAPEAFANFRFRVIGSMMMKLRMNDHEREFFK
jgi:hypothetical protein